MGPHDLGALRARLSRRTLPRRPAARRGEVAFAGTPFARLARFNRGGLFVGRFIGRTPWERHRHGDELVQVLDGEVDLTVMTRPRLMRVTLRPGSMFVVPRGLWHRQHARSGVTLLSATPTPTDICLTEGAPSPKRRGPATTRSGARGRG
jgi:quercetin dioxygenase-like cupin family protein